MNKLDEYVLRYQGIHSGTDPYMGPDGKLYNNQQDPTKGKTLFDGSQLGKKLVPYIQQVIDAKRRAVTLLDYGSGKAIHTYIPLPAHGNKTLLGRFNGMIQCYYAYDPAVKKYSMKPPLGMVFDITCCADVMEHVPEEFVPVVLAEIGNYTKPNGAIMFSISSNPAKKKFQDGEDLHATIKSLDWWINAIRNYCGDKSFILAHDENSRLGPNDPGEMATFIRYYNSPKFPVWNLQGVDRAEEIK